MTEPQLQPSTTPSGLTPAPPDAPAGEIRAEEIQMVFDPRGQVAEQFRSLRNSIIALNPDGAPRSVVFTSAVAGEGKTVAAINLAIAMAELPGNHVLLVDANLHDPSLERYLGLERHQGLADVLRGRCALDAAIRHTAVENVSVIGAGTLPENPSKLLGSDRTRVVLSTLKQRFSYVLIDSPEALSISDASLLGAMVDGIVLVVKMNDTTKTLVEQTYNQLETLGGNVLGTCLTHCGSGGQEPAKKGKKK
jgi:capsular exopolysaccharide synthesis family protein